MKKLMAMCALVGLVGCTQTSSQSSGTPAADVQVAKQHAAPMVARRGHLPMDYAIAGSARHVRVVDVTTGKRVWESRVGFNTQLRVAADGVRVNSLHVYQRKLKKRDVYEIVLVRE